MVPKFRFFDTEENKMHVVDSLYTFKSLGGKDITIATEDIDISEWRSYSDGVLMQSTGLKDKNGVEIFEGDIVVFNDESDSKHIICTFLSCFGIRFNDIGFTAISTMFDGSISTEDAFTVIGNIYQNPHLLEE